MNKRINWLTYVLAGALLFFTAARLTTAPGYRCWICEPEAWSMCHNFCGYNDPCIGIRPLSGFCVMTGVWSGVCISNYEMMCESRRKEYIDCMTWVFSCD